MLKDAWTLAIDTLACVETQRLGERLALIKTVKKLRISDRKTIGLAHRMISETLRKRNYIDFFLNLVLEPLSLIDLKLCVRIFLRLYFHEIKIANGNLEKASKIARIGRSILGWQSLKEFEIALGKILTINLIQPLLQLEEIKKVGLETYNPAWFVKYCFRLLGRDEALKLLKKSADVPPIYIRLNTLNSPEDSLLRSLEREKIVIEKVPQVKHTYKLIKTNSPLTRTKSFRHGLFYIQDKASCLAAEIADPKQGITVLDICAAPGSKTTYLAQLMENRGEIISIDNSKRRMEVWKRETERMGTEICQPIIANARNNLPLNIKADLVILDPPCTSTGTFGKTPEAKWRLTKRSALGMSLIQSEMVNECGKYVKQNGFMIYSTCSITVEENEMVIENFLRLHPEFKLAESKPKIGLQGFRGLTQCQRLFPHIHDSNGFFLAKLKKLYEIE